MIEPVAIGPWENQLIRPRLSCSLHLSASCVLVTEEDEGTRLLPLPTVIPPSVYFAFGCASPSISGVGGAPDVGLGAGFVATDS